MGQRSRRSTCAGIHQRWRMPVLSSNGRRRDLVKELPSIDDSTGRNCTESFACVERITSHQTCCHRGPICDGHEQPRSLSQTNRPVRSARPFVYRMVSVEQRLQGGITSHTESELGSTIFWQVMCRLPCDGGGPQNRDVFSSFSRLFYLPRQRRSEAFKTTIESYLFQEANGSCPSGDVNLRAVSY